MDILFSKWRTRLAIATCQDCQRRNEYKQDFLKKSDRMPKKVLWLIVEVVSDLIEQAKSQNPWKVLVVDDYALKILSTATKLFDLAEERISG